jgi:hypothetical protein
MMSALIETEEVAQVEVAVFASSAVGDRPHMHEALVA